MIQDKSNQYTAIPRLKEGIEKGLKKGLEQGRKEECFKNAKKMKQAGIAFDVIAQVTGLSIGEIASL